MFFINMVYVITVCHFTLSHRCMFRVLDSFGTYVEFNFPGYRFDVAVLWGHQDLIPTQFMTLYRKCSGVSCYKHSMISCYMVMLLLMKLSARLSPMLCWLKDRSVFRENQIVSEFIPYSLVFFQPDVPRDWTRN